MVTNFHTSDVFRRHLVKESCWPVICHLSNTSMYYGTHVHCCMTNYRTVCLLCLLGSGWIIGSTRKFCRAKTSQRSHSDRNFNKIERVGMEILTVVDYLLYTFIAPHTLNIVCMQFLCVLLLLKPINQGIFQASHCCPLYNIPDSAFCVCPPGRRK